jgi:hypothetical protein
MQDLHKVHEQISLIRVNNEKELRRYNVDELACSVHGYEAERRFPLFLVYYRGRIRAYFQISERVVISPGFNPDLLDPKDFVRIVRDLAIEAKRQYGDPIFLLCGLAEQLGTEHMKTLRLKKTPEMAYTYTEEE